MSKLLTFDSSSCIATIGTFVALSPVVVRTDGLYGYGYAAIGTRVAPVPRVIIDLTETRCNYIGSAVVFTAFSNRSPFYFCINQNGNVVHRVGSYEVRFVDT